ncbi:hypothetical protein GCM10010156_48940 [Planobispora rosea]|uniref:Uncharacterized protein n=1 Tax=Planobispora rosea TaxID=35762 RepID=A0A8J3WEI0_PLARO|nr:hypothetical protein [Planobispora rosea]GGS84532.1 hypothetical protein GCM10010156_48940 [Planobispora rosea]GIH86405.1 hypothetical protein Pro02_48130 [Planobispora rosea]
MAMTRRAAKAPAVPALAPLAVEVPPWPVLDRWRRRLVAVRSATGRLATLAGACAAATGLFTGELTGLCLLADAALSLGGLATLRLWKPNGHQKATASVLYVLPGTSLAALLIAQQLTPGIHPVATPIEAAALTAWTVGTWVLRPAEIGRRMLTPPPPAAVELAPAGPVVSEHPAAAWWAAKAAVVGGVAPATVLEAIESTGPRAMRAIIRSALPGEPVPDISIRRLSALMDIAEDEITITAVSGRGAGVRRLTVGRPEQADDLATRWATQVAPSAMPGTVLKEVQIGTPGGQVRTIPIGRDDA